MNDYILVTGATSGIGKGVAERLHQLGNKVVLHGRNEEQLKELSKQLNCLYWCHDFSSAEATSSSLLNFLKLNQICIKKLVHCAGVDNTYPSKSLTYSVFEDLMKVNFYSAVEIINILLKRSANKNTLNNILFISSISSIKGFKAKGAYSASKAALDSYMRVLSKELAPKIRVNSILPGAIKTKMTEHTFQNEQMLNHFKEIYPLGIGEVTNIVDAVEIYLSQKTSWVTGQQVIIDGGMI